MASLFVPKKAFVRWYCAPCGYHHERPAAKTDVDSTLTHSVIDLGATDLRCPKDKARDEVEEPTGLGAVVLADVTSAMKQPGRRKWISNGHGWVDEGAPAKGNASWIWSVPWSDLVNPMVMHKGWEKKCTCGDRPDTSKHAQRCPMSEERAE